MFPYSSQFKFNGKIVMGKSIPIWIKATILVVGLQLACLFVEQGVVGGFQSGFVSLASAPEAVTGWSFSPDGFQLIARLDMLGVAAVMAMTYGQALRLAGMTLAVILLLAPLKIGVLEKYWKVHREESLESVEISRWYKNPKLFGKAVLVELILSIGCQVIAVLAILPSLLLYFFVYGQDMMGAGEQEILWISMLVFVALALLIAGMLFAFFCYTTIQPICYCLAAQPEYSMGQVWRRGLNSIKGYRGKFFCFRLSFLFWYILSNVTYGTLELYILPYISFSSFQFLNAAAEDRREKKERESE